MSDDWVLIHGFLFNSGVHYVTTSAVYHQKAKEQFIKHYKTLIIL